MTDVRGRVLNVNEVWERLGVLSTYDPLPLSILFEGEYGYVVEAREVQGRIELVCKGEKEIKRDAND